jgi:hypothetical protein
LFLYEKLPTTKQRVEIVHAAPAGNLGGNVLNGMVFVCRYGADPGDIFFCSLPV